MRWPWGYAIGTRSGVMAFGAILYAVYGAVAGIVLVVPTLRLLDRARRRWRVKRKLCHACGYDLRASDGNCPECGTPNPRPQLTGDARE